MILKILTLLNSFLFITAVLFIRCSMERLPRPSEIFLSKKSKISISAIGDVMLHAPQLTSAYQKDCKCWDFKPVFEEVKPHIEKDDLSIGNLETTLPGDPKLFSAYPEFGSPDEIVSAMKYIGMDVLTTSNNHSMDKGKKGLIRTLDVLDKEGVHHTGTFRSNDEYTQKPFLIVKAKDWKIAILAYTYGTNGIAVPKAVKVNLIDKKQIADDLEKALGERPDLVIVSYHFGDEYQRFPNSFQKEIVQYSFEEGADVVLGSHPHVLQPYEYQEVKDKYGHTKKRLAIFSLGNFISSQYWRYSNGGIIFRFEAEKTGNDLMIQNVSYVPVFVYSSYEKGRKYYLLDAKNYLQNDRSMRLTNIAHRNLVEFYEDTLRHLGNRQ
ncbi:MAG: CapA family protein [Leptospiraceae bacterium]|nr:CapA family protein [Leptospiraceae bacterium]